MRLLISYLYNIQISADDFEGGRLADGQTQAIEDAWGRDGQSQNKEKLRIKNMSQEMIEYESKVKKWIVKF